MSQASTAKRTRQATSAIASARSATPFNQGGITAIGDGLYWKRLLVASLPPGYRVSPSSDRNSTFAPPAASPLQSGGGGASVVSASAAASTAASTAASSVLAPSTAGASTAVTASAGKAASCWFEPPPAHATSISNIAV